MERFEELLVELGELLHTPLSPDRNRACKLNVNVGQLHVQLECDQVQERLLMATFVTEIPAGRFRENVFKEALKANYSYPRIGIFAYSEANNQLVCFQHYSFSNLTGEKLQPLLNQFIEYSLLWKNAIEGGLPGPQTAFPIR